jgi:4-aminobutyrate aminotransferase-like enzyme
VSAVVGRADVLSAWQREPEVVHTSTFAGAPLACAAALTTLDVLERERLIERSREIGLRFRRRLEQRLASRPASVSVRGVGLMLGIELGSEPGRGSSLQSKLLERGYLTSTGGGQREVLVLTPPLNISEALLESFVEALVDSLEELE